MMMVDDKVGSRGRLRGWYRANRGACWASLAVITGYTLLTFLRVPVVLAGAGVGFFLGFEFEPMVPGLLVLLFNCMAFGVLGIQLACHLGQRDGHRPNLKHWGWTLGVGIVLTLIFAFSSSRRSFSIFEITVPLLACLGGSFFALMQLERRGRRPRLLRISWYLIAGTAAAVFIYTNTGVGRRVKAETMEHIYTLERMHASGEIEGNELGDWLTAAFTVAKNRTGKHDAVRQNRAALLALGYIVGHPDVAELAKIPVSPDTIEWSKSVRGRIRLRQRGDWPRHFTVSAALDVMRDLELSDGVGHLKEVRDSMGGSGFSFTDVLANRAGILLADKSVDSRLDARAMQRAVSAGPAVERFHPDPGGLPDDMQRPVFRAEYGGVGGQGYKRVMDDIMTRLQSCDLLQ